MAEVPEDLNEGVSDELEAFVPEVLPTSGVISTAQKYHTLYLKVYETLQVQQIGGTQHLQTTFCTLNDADLESFRGIICKANRANSAGKLQNVLGTIQRS